MRNVNVGKWSAVLGFSVLAALMSGCVSALPPTRAFVRPGPSYASAIPQVRRVGLITDAVVRYDRANTNDYFCIEDSLAALTNLVSDAAAYLHTKGYEVAFAEPCFAGSFKDTPTVRVSTKRHDKPTDQPAPFYVNPSLASDQSYRDAVSRVVQRAHHAIVNAGELPTDTFLDDPNVRESLKVIAGKKQVDYLLVAVGDGLLVSAGKQAGQAIGSTLASIFITLGNASVTAHNVSFMDSAVALINVQNGEVLWSNSLRILGNPAEPAFYKGNWGRLMLYHFADRNPPPSKKT